MESQEQKEGSSPQSESAQSRRGRLMLFYSSWADACKPYPRSIGFRNNENNIMCYRNSALVVLMHIPVFLNWLELHLEEACNRSQSGKDCIICLMAHLSKTYWSGDVLTDQITDLVRQVWDVSKAGFWKPDRLDQQQDCPEYLTGLIQYLKGGGFDDDSNGESDAAQELWNRTATIDHMFQTVIKNKDTCRSCHVTKYRGHDLISSLPANIVKAKKREPPAIEDCIAEFLGDSELSDLHCDNCKQKTTWDRHVFIRDAPEVLIVQINRFSPGYPARNAAKVSFKGDLDITEQLDGHAVKGGEKLKYKLNAVVYHSGTMIHSGHYVCNVKGPTGEWCLIDDHKVTRIDGDITTYRPPVKGRVPYVLVYTRQPLNSGPPVPLPEPDTSLMMSEEDVSAVEQQKEGQAGEAAERSEEADGYQSSDDGHLTPEDEGSDGLIELAGSGGVSKASLSSSIRIGPDAIRPDEEEKWGKEKRWEGQAARVVIKITMEDVVLTGHLRGLFKKTKRNTSLSATAKPQGVSKSKGPSQPPSPTK